MNAEQIMEKLGVSRSNVSMSLKELQAWNLVRLVHLPDDRRDYFTTPEDLWEIVRTLVDERKKREIDPTLTKLRELQLQAPSGGQDDYAHKRIAEMADLIELLTGWYADMNRLETDRLIQLLGLGTKVLKLIETTERIVPMSGRVKVKTATQAKNSPEKRMVIGVSRST